MNLTPGLNTPPTPTRTPEPPRPEVPPTAEATSVPVMAAPAGDQPKGSRLIVGPDIKLKGVEITDCDTLVVEGRVEASMDSRVVQIAENRVFSGTVGIDVAEIRGRFEGELTARKHLVIHAGGKVSGRIRYGKLTVEEGGELSGDVSTLGTTSSSTRIAEPGGTVGVTAGGNTESENDSLNAYDPFARKAKPVGAR